MVLTAIAQWLQAAMLTQPGDLSPGLLTQLGNYFQQPAAAAPPPAPGLQPTQAWDAPSTGPFRAGGSNTGSSQMNGAALTGAASGLQAAAQSLLRQRMEALRQQGVGLRGAFAPPPPALGHWEVLY